MKTAVIYASKTGNTKQIAEAVKEELGKENVVYFGEAPEEVPEAEFYVIGSWTDKGNADKEIISFIKKLKNKKVAYFGTAGYGGSTEYYEALYHRVKENIDSSNEITGYFFCQGRMPESVRTRYVKLLTEHPEDEKLKVSLENFDEAMSHPDETDIRNARMWAKGLI